MMDVLWGGSIINPKPTTIKTEIIRKNNKKRFLSGLIVSCSVMLATGKVKS
jgi:hypothetical protein